MKSIVAGLLIAIAATLAPLSPSAAGAPADDLVSADIHFAVTQTDLIAGVAAVRASCSVNASGEPLAVLANGTARSTIAVAPGPCSIVLVLFGVDVGLPVFNTTPLGRSSFFIPGVATVSLGLADLTVDLVTSLNSTTRVASGIADVDAPEMDWRSWGAQRFHVRGIDDVGSVVSGELNTTFTYSMSVALTVYALSIEVYHVDLAAIGSFVGAPSLLTDLSVDLRPHALSLDAPTEVTHDRAWFSWTGTVDADVDHLELRLTDATGEMSIRLAPSVRRAEAVLRPSTAYEARIVSVDAGGQAVPSNPVTFASAAAPASAPLEAQGNPALTWTLVALAALAGVVGFAVGNLRRRRD